MLKMKEIIISMALLFMLVGCNSSDSFSSSESERINKFPSVELKPSNWYIRVVAEDPSRAMKTESSQLGVLEVSDAVQNHTLSALSPFGGSYLDIVFVDPDGMNSGEYKTNFHVYEENVEDRWRFTVKTDDDNADIILTWMGLYILRPYIDEQNRQRYKEHRSMTNPLIKYMKLVDSTNGTEIAALVNGKVQTYSFNMEGQTERNFEWVLVTDKVSIPEQTSRLSALKAKAIQKDTAIEKTSIMRKRLERFDLSKPPKIKEGTIGQ